MIDLDLKLLRDHWIELTTFHLKFFEVYCFCFNSTPILSIIIPSFILVKAHVIKPFGYSQSDDDKLMSKGLIALIMQIAIEKHLLRLVLS